MSHSATPRPHSILSPIGAPRGWGLASDQLDKANELGNPVPKLRHPSCAGLLNRLKNALEEGDEEQATFIEDYGLSLYGGNFVAPAEEMKALFRSGDDDAVHRSVAAFEDASVQRKSTAA